MVPDIETNLGWQLNEEFEFWKVHFEDEQLDALHDIFFPIEPLHKLVFEDDLDSMWLLRTYGLTILFGRLVGENAE
jgi:hypothetical protein